ncbi:MAG: peptide deformylase [Slackia sp.]|nr:peptide deformylase [Slackia sp.]
MIRPIMKSEFFLQQPSEPATPLDAPIARDLLDTLAVHAHECVGMAANMIGQRKRIIVFMDDDTPRVMLNPEIIETAHPYDTEESCLSLVGMRETQRFRTIRVRYRNLSFEEHIEMFSDFTAQIIQHEIDHCNGVVI